MVIEVLLCVVPQTAVWSAKTAAVMIGANIFCILAGRYSIEVKEVGPYLPFTGSFSKFTLPELVASLSFGHLIGVGSILGLGYLGIMS